MKSGNKLIISKSKIENAIKNTSTMGGASKFLNLDWRTFKRIAKEYNLYSPKHANQFSGKFKLEDILNGKYPQYPTSKISKRLVEEGLREYKCEKCGIHDWNNLPIALELNHKNGDNSDHKLENLELLCPNCHSQTPTFRSKKIKFLRLMEV